MGERTWKDWLTAWSLVLVAGGVFAGLLSLWRSVDVRRSLTVSTGIDARWVIPVRYVGEDFESLQACDGELDGGSPEADVVDLGVGRGEAAEAAPAYIAGPSTLSYQFDALDVGTYWSLKPPDLTLRLKVRLAHAGIEPPPHVDVHFRGCVSIADAYWDDQEADAAKTLQAAREKGDSAIVARAEAFVEELAQRRALLGAPH